MSVPHKQKQRLTPQEKEARWTAYKLCRMIDYCKLSGRDARVLKDQAKRYNIRFSGPVVDLSEVLPALHDFLSTYGPIVRRMERTGLDLVDDPVLVGGSSSPALERYRLARAGLAEHELARARGEFLPSSVIGEGLRAFAHRMRSFSKVLEQRRDVELMDLFDGVTDDALRSMIGVLNSAIEKEGS